MKKLKLFIVSSFALFGLFSLVSVSHTSAVDVGQAVCDEDVEFRPEICGDLRQPDNPDNAINPLYGPDGILTRAVSGLSLVLGVVAVLVIIVAGIQMTLSTGDPGKVNQSRDAIIYAAVGLIVAVLAQAIVRFVLNRIGV